MMNSLRADAEALIPHTPGCRRKIMGSGWEACNCPRAAFLAALSQMQNASIVSDGEREAWRLREVALQDSINGCAQRVLQLKTAKDAAEAHLAQLTAELKQWETWGIIEIAVRNVNVSSYMNHWEGRALKAEAELSALTAERDRLTALVEQWREDVRGYPRETPEGYYAAVAVELCAKELAAALQRGTPAR